MMTEEQAHNYIKEEIEGNEIVVFMKGTPDFPMCGFSGRVVQILRHFGADFKGINVLDDEGLRQSIKTYSRWPTIPQIFIKGEFVGGCDIAMEMAQSGELETMLQKQN